VHIGYGTEIWLSVAKLSLQCAVVSLYSVIKQWLKCNTGKVCNCLIQFLLTMVLSIEECVFLVECVFQEGSRYTNLVHRPFPEKFPETNIPHRNAVCRLIEKTKLVQACMVTRGHNFQSFCKCTETFLNTLYLFFLHSVLSTDYTQTVSTLHLNLIWCLWRSIRTISSGSFVLPEDGAHTTPKHVEATLIF
jgi:hypothetical protein